MRAMASSFDGDIRSNLQNFHCSFELTTVSAAPAAATSSAASRWVRSACAHCSASRLVFVRSANTLRNPSRLNRNSLVSGRSCAGLSTQPSGLLAFTVGASSSDLLSPLVLPPPLPPPLSPPPPPPPLTPLPPAAAASVLSSSHSTRSPTRTSSKASTPRTLRPCFASSRDAYQLIFFSRSTNQRHCHWKPSADGFAFSSQPSISGSPSLSFLRTVLANETCLACCLPRRNGACAPKSSPSALGPPKLHTRGLQCTSVMKESLCLNPRKASQMDNKWQRIPEKYAPPRHSRMSFFLRRRRRRALRAQLCEAGHSCSRDRSHPSPRAPVCGAAVAISAAIGRGASDLWWRDLR